jgi:iron complex transport system substrate-binding protein
MVARRGAGRQASLTAARAVPDIPQPMTRIASLLPSATDIVCALGLGDHLVAISHECDDPSPARALPRVTASLIPDGTAGEIDRAVRERVGARQPLYALDSAALARVAPDLIVTQALCDVCAVAEEDVRAVACALPSAPRVVNLEPRTLDDLYVCIRQVAAAAGVAPAGEQLVGRLEARVAVVAQRAEDRPRHRMVFLEWLDPPFSSGHWNPEIVRLAGGHDPFGRPGEPARTLRWDDVVAWRPEVVFVACCGFDADRALADLRGSARPPGWDDLPAVRAGRVYVADGARYFSRPGPGLVDSLELLAHALDPDAHARPREGNALREHRLSA